MAGDHSHDILARLRFLAVSTVVVGCCWALARTSELGGRHRRLLWTPPDPDSVVILAHMSCDDDAPPDLSPTE